MVSANRNKQMREAIPVGNGHSTTMRLLVLGLIFHLVIGILVKNDLVLIVKFH